MTIRFVCWYSVKTLLLMEIHEKNHLTQLPFGFSESEQGGLFLPVTLGIQFWFDFSYLNCLSLKTITLLKIIRLEAIYNTFFIKFCLLLLF